MKRREFFGRVLFCVSMPLWAMSRKMGNGPEGVKWRFSSFGWTRMAVPANVWMELESGKFRGNAGCNGLGGTYRLDGSSIRFRQGPSTMMACPAIGLEAKFRKALDQVDRFELKGENLILKKGKQALLVFSRDGA